MNNDYFPLIVLIMLFIWNAYLMKQNNELTNKLMSKNYAEYESIKHPYVAPVEDEAKEDYINPYDKQRANELNGGLGIG